MRAVHVVITNETAGHVFSEYVDKLDESHILGAEPSMGDIYRCYAKEYGRCTSKVYNDQKDGPPKAVGWFFVSSQEYEDTHEPYLRGAWVTVGEYVPARKESVA